MKKKTVSGQQSNPKKSENRRQNRPKSRTRGAISDLPFENLENRQLLAALFPAYINGVLTLGDPAAPVPYRLEDTFLLESNPFSTKTIYLDFNGHHSRNNAWNHDVIFPAFDLDGNPNSFSTAELIEIQKTWQQTAEDFAAFDVNVTTRDLGLDRILRNTPDDEFYGIRSLMTQQTPDFNGPWGGIAILNSFGRSDDTPCFTVNKGFRVGGLTASHEVGHTLGLRHDGLGSQAYHPGTGSGTMSWGPIMGAPFSANNTQWSRGEYADATNTEDDYVVMRNRGLQVRADDHGNTRATASTANMSSSTRIFDWGFISSPSDVDFFKFETGAGRISLRVSPFAEHPNLKPAIELYNEAGQLLASHNPANQFETSISIEVPQGVYYLRIDGVGHVNNNSVDYGSMGFYIFEGDILEPVRGPKAVGEVWTVELDSNWRTFRFNNNYAEPPVVVFGGLSRNGSDPSTVRVRNVTRTTFEARIEEWDYLDKVHGPETVSYMVFQPGVYNLDGGMRLEVGRTTANHHWKSVSFSRGPGDPGFASNPIVFAQISTTREWSAVTPRIQNVTRTGFQIQVQEEENADQIHQSESINYIAITPGVGAHNGRRIEAGLTGVSVTHRPFIVDFNSDFTGRPALFLAMQSYNEFDTATVRVLNNNRFRTRFFVEEERSKDSEIQHRAEAVAYLAMQNGRVLYQDESAMPPAFMMATYRNTDDHGVLRQALLQLQELDKTHITLPCACENDGCCVCPSCCGQMLADDGWNFNQLAAAVFGQQDRVDSRAPSTDSAGAIVSRSPISMAQSRRLAGAIESLTSSDRERLPSESPAEVSNSPDAWRELVDLFENRQV